MAVIHIVHFQYNRSACDAATKADIADRFLKLKQKCLNKDGKPYILDITGGTNNSPEGVAEKLEHSFVVKFANLQDRDYYLSGDAVHAEFGKYVHGNGLERAVVLDFEEGVF